MRLTYLAIILIFISCSNSKTVQVDQESYIPESGREGPIQTGTSKIKLEQKDQVIISLERTACYGQCPTYRIIVRKDGTALYNGVNFVEKKGVYQGKISQELIDKMFVEADKIDFFNLQDKYDEPITDIPSTIITMTRGNTQKRVIDRSGGPKELKAFEKYLEERLMEIEWTAAPEVKPEKVSTDFD